MDLKQGITRLSTLKILFLPQKPRGIFSFFYYRVADFFEQK